MMKKIVVGIIGVGLLLLGLVYFMGNRMKYNWKAEEYGNVNSEEPFGAYFLKKHLDENWKGGVVVDTMLFKSLEKNEKKRCNYLVFVKNEYANIEGKDRDNLLDCVKKGNNVLFVTYNYDACGLFDIDAFGANYFDIEELKRRKSSYHHMGLFYNTGEKVLKNPDCEVWSNMIHWRFTHFRDSVRDEKSEREYKTCVAPYCENVVMSSYGCVVFQRRMERGSVTFCGVPSLFSNYAMSDSAMCSLSDKVLQKVFSEKEPIVFVNYEYTFVDREYYSSTNKNTVFEVLLNEKASALALYCLLAALLLCVLINGRRRRAARMDEPLEQNASISFVKHLATLYSARSDYKDLLEIEQRTLLYRLRKEYRFDYHTKDFTLPSDYAECIAQSKNLDEEHIREALRRMESLVSQEGLLTQESYLNCLKQVEDALSKQ